MKKRNKTTITTAAAATGSASEENSTIGTTISTSPDTLPATAGSTTSTTAAETAAATAPDEVMGSVGIADDDHFHAGQEKMAVGNNAVQSAMSTTTTATVPASDRTGANTSTGTTPTTTAAISDLCPTDPAQARLNACFCAVLRLVKAMLAALIGAGVELAKVQEELGAGFDEFITTKTPWNMTEVRALVTFAAQAGLSPEGLTPAHDVASARMMAAVALLGRLYTAETEVAHEHA